MGAASLYGVAPSRQVNLLTYRRLDSCVGKRVGMRRCRREYRNPLTFSAQRLFFYWSGLGGTDRCMGPDGLTSVAGRECRSAR